MDTSKKQNSRQQYASDYKEEIIRMLNSGKKVQELSKTFGIGENVLYDCNWITEANSIKIKSQSQKSKSKVKVKVKINEERSSRIGGSIQFELNF